MSNNKNTLGILISYEGLSQIVESQMISHADFISKNGFPNEVWILCGTRKIHRDSVCKKEALESKYKAPIKLIRACSHNFPFAPIINAIILRLSIWKRGEKISWLHARTEQIGAVAVILKFLMSFRMIYDVRGDTRSEVMALASKNKGVLRASLLCKATMLYCFHWISMAHADHCVFVSSALASKNKKWLKKNKYSVIPCLVDEEKFYYDDKLRQNIRNVFCFNRDDIVIGYLGSASHYQCIDETMKFIGILLDSNQNIKALILSRDIEEFKTKISKRHSKRVYLRSCSHEEINQYLNALDYAFLLRENNFLNFVSSPIKFAEYSMTGLRVITTRAIDQVCENNTILDNCHFMELGCTDNKLELTGGMGNLKKRSLIAQKSLNLYSRNSFTHEFLKIYGINSRY